MLDGRGNVASDQVALVDLVQIVVIERRLSKIRERLKSAVINLAVFVQERKLFGMLGPALGLHDHFRFPEILVILDVDDFERRNALRDQTETAL